MTGRSTDEWIGATPDTAVPPRVRIRVFERAKGLCHISGRRILVGDLWDLEHVIALCNGGENRETNLAPALRDKHRAKSAEDLVVKSKIARIRAKHLGIAPASKRKIPSRPFFRSAP